MTDTNQLPEPDHELAELAAMRKAKKITDYKEFIAYYGKQAAYWEQRLKELDMTDTNQQLPSEREAFEAFAQNCPMGKYSIARRGDGYDSSHTQLMWDAWQARAPVQGEPSWWMRETDEGAEWTDTAPLVLSDWTPLYTTPQPAQATQTEVTDSMIREAFLANGFTIKDGHSDLKPYVYAAARAILALRPQAAVQMTCHCHTCRPITMDDMRMVLCPKCGNKRCPHANDHRNDCTGSNEPGQPGSAYPAHHGITDQSKKGKP